MTIEEAAPKKRPGRPATGKRGNFTFRVTDRLRSQLEDAAKAEHLSVSEVIESRLKGSFEEDARVAKESASARRMGRMLMRVWQDVDDLFGPEWADHVSGRAAMQSALLETVRFGVPAKPIEEMTEAEKAETAHLAEAVKAIVDAATNRHIPLKPNTTGNKLFDALFSQPATFIDTHNALRKDRPR